MKNTVKKLPNRGSHMNFFPKFLFCIIFLGVIGSYVLTVTKKQSYAFPALTGTHAVGTKTFYIKNHSRELTIQAWYPTKGKPDRPTTPYAYEAKEMLRIGLLNLIQSKYQEPKRSKALKQLKFLDNITTHAITNAPELSKGSPSPIIIFGHGYGMNRGGYSFYCEDIASHGYVVFMVMHTYVNELTKFSDDSEALCLEETNNIPETYLAPNRTIVQTYPRNNETLEVCVTDITLMLNHIIDGTLDQTLTALCDTTKIGIVGHSLGGIMASQLCRRDTRIKAGISLDGPLWGQDGTTPFHKPFIFIHAPNFYDWTTETTMLNNFGLERKQWLSDSKKFYAKNGTDSSQVLIPNADHNTFADETILTGMLTHMLNSKDINLDGGTLNLKELNAIRRRIISFFDRYLKNIGSVKE